MPGKPESFLRLLPSPLSSRRLGCLSIQLSLLNQTGMAQNEGAILFRHTNEFQAYRNRIVNKTTSAIGRPFLSCEGSNHQSYTATRQGWSISMLPVERMMSTFLTAPSDRLKFSAPESGSGLARNAPAPGESGGGWSSIFLPSRTSNRPSCKTAEMDVLEKGSDSESLSCAGSADGRSRPGARLSPVETNAGAAGAGVTAGVDCTGEGGATAGFTGVISSVGFGGDFLPPLRWRNNWRGRQWRRHRQRDRRDVPRRLWRSAAAVPEAGPAAARRTFRRALATDSSATFGARAKRIGSLHFTHRRFL